MRYRREDLKLSSQRIYNTGRKKIMLKLQMFLANLIRDRKGQDMVEYALLAGFIAVAAGALLPGISTSISTIFSRMASVVSAAAAA
jgi:pilus assembly protein Flp/PilA